MDRTDAACASLAATRAIELDDVSRASIADDLRRADDLEELLGR